MKTIVVGLFALIFALPLEARGKMGKNDGRGFGEGRGGPRRAMLFKDLDLTPEQVTALTGLRQTHQATILELRTRVSSTRLALRDALTSPTMAQAKVDALVEQLSGLHKELLQRRVAFVLALRKVLTAEQLAKLDLEALWPGGPGGMGDTTGFGGIGPVEEP